NLHQKETYAVDGVCVAAIDSAEASNGPRRKMRTLAVAFLTCAFVIAADSPFLGTWTMNKSQSKLDPNGPKYDSLTVQFTQDGPSLKSVVTTNGTAAPP